jgi:hypothetical protein
MPGGQPAPKESMAVKKKKQVATSRWHDGVTPIDELGACEQLAHQLVSEYRDLTPSVERIMAAEELDDEQRLSALMSFSASLATIGDPNRDPRTAIANAIG